MNKLKLILCGIALTMTSCVTAKAGDAFKAFVPKGQVGFTMAKKYADTETDPVKKATQQALIAQAEMDYLLSANDFLNLISNGSYNPDELAKYLALIEQLRLEIESVKSTVTSKPAK